MGGIDPTISCRSATDWATTGCNHGAAEDKSKGDLASQEEDRSGVDKE